MIGARRARHFTGPPAVQLRPRRRVMTLVHGNPFGNFISVSDEMDRLFHGAFGQDGGNGDTGVTSTWEPPVDIYETDDALVLEVELPGVSKDAVSVELHEHTLKLSGERKREPSV